MKHNIKFKLAMTMMVFALVISITLAITNYYDHKSEAIDYERRIIEEKINLLRYALETSERATSSIDTNITAEMKIVSSQLERLYKQNPDFSKWDFRILSKHYNSDIYIIDEYNKILYSNVSQDVGLDFNLCCSTLAKVLDERRIHGGFYFDGFDVEQTTGNIKSYSYSATSDHKYIIQLGHSWDDNPLFMQFNFLNTINRLKETNTAILDINVLNRGGLAYGKPEDEFSLDVKSRESFMHTLNTGEDSSFVGIFNDEQATFYFSQYISELDSGTSQKKVIELIYSKDSLQTILSKHRNAFAIEVFIILFVTTILSFLLSRWISKPIHMAFHDSLTGLGNRAYFEEYVERKFISTYNPCSLMMIDLDNFKLVNDTYGHDTGDQLLKITARMMEHALLNGEFVFRLGGDEFIIIIPSNDVTRVEALADYLLVTFRENISPNYELTAPVSLSIGISYFNETVQDIQSIMRNADQALYKSKKQGKNTYSS